MVHLSKSIISEKGTELSGKTVIFCVTSSVAIYYAPQIARELMRHGAEVVFVSSEEAQSLIGSKLLHWASGNSPIGELSGETEHISLVGLPEMKDNRIVLVYPTTANTLCKIASGIADTPPTLIISTALGNSVPVIIVPAMHLALYQNPATQKALSTLTEMDLTVIPPLIQGDKAHIASLEETIATVIKKATHPTMIGKKVLITTGATREYFDAIRFISNPSSGKMGIAIANEVWNHGGDPTLVVGHLDVPCPSWINCIHVTSSQEMYNSCVNELREKVYDTVILAAAMGDFAPSSRSPMKTSSTGGISLDLQPTKKLSDIIREISPSSRIILFKAEYGVERQDLIARAREKLIKTSSDLIVANDLAEPDAGFSVDTNRVIILTKENDDPEEFFGTKDALARKIVKWLTRKKP
ncbi:MAG: bifunctional phosphopantothenoylcysteine decarboxylase/phosphopantothenate--cysteine ligase CoaBC [Promethearchaeota archaeon]